MENPKYAKRKKKAREKEEEAPEVLRAAIKMNKMFNIQEKAKEKEAHLCTGLVDATPEEIIEARKKIKEKPETEIIDR
jgi:hypothetical protein